ncbi:molybdopterin-dependent oxidoreductase [Nocardioides sp. 503]|uniref:molybdopterin-dependent oxidoreductase n=1 Tax=Nocardioides sp. 503 TaxID=2508326 RepID=UPI00106F8C24|nr:molybdopterin-dependent oxidoreductase [Nocardioides sp. 503]
MTEERTDYGFPARAWAGIARRRPPGLDRVAWRSPLRGPWLTSVLGAVLLASIPVVILTGLLSYVAYGEQARPSDVGWLHLPMFDWPTDPSWLFRLTQGLHVGLGLVLVPVVLAKLWSVIPRLFAWPPARSAAQALERLTLLMLVGGLLFEIVTGVLNIQYDYVFGFSFYTAHYYGAWVFIVGFVSHVALKLPTMVRSLRTRSLREELRTRRADTRPERVAPDDGAGLVAADPAAPTMSRRGLLALVGGGSLLTFALTAGQTVGGPTRRLALLLPRGLDSGDGPLDFPVNKTAEAAAIVTASTGATWRLSLEGDGPTVTLDREQLLAMTQHTAVLPIACVEGWSTTQTWTGVRLRDLAAQVGIGEPTGAFVKSLQEQGAFKAADLNAGQVSHADALLALQVNGVDLSLDHGFPARIIVPAMPGVLNTKWVASIRFEGS